MSIEMPKFNLKVSQDDLSKAVEHKPKFFGPGEYDVKIENVEYTKMASDKTWAVYMVTLTDGSRSIKTAVLVPTTRIVYTKPGGKPTYAVYHKYKSFLRGLGQDLNEASPEEIGVITKTVFGNPERLKGETVRAIIGFNGPHVLMNPEDKTFSLKNKDGSSMVDTVFPDRDAAIAYAATLGVLPQTFSNVLDFVAKSGASEASDSSNPWND